MKRRLLTLAASAAVMLGLIVVAVPSPALAAQSQCLSGQMCLWEHKSYGGIFYGLGNITPNVCYNLNNNSINDKATSIYNRSGSHVFVYKNTGCTGTSDGYNNGSGDSDLSFIISVMNDSISSYKRI